MEHELLSLPWQVQVALASGFAGYLTAYSGQREGHETVDVTFYTLLYGLFASSAYGLFAKELLQVPSGLAAFGVTVVLGALWRKWGCHLWSNVLSALDVSHSDDAPSSLSALSSRTDVRLTGAAVFLDDDTWLMCDDTRAFADATHAPITLGQDGGIIMYVSATEKPDGTVKISKTVRDKNYGDRLTYVPAARIKRINLRYKKA
jgi:hypothetical protein